jgi:DNA-binding NarL/FixJ family response regulator
MNLDSFEHHPLLAELADRDLEITRLLARGCSLAQIADAPGLGDKTIANTSAQIKGKLGVTHISDLVRLAVQAGLD